MSQETCLCNLCQTEWDAFKHFRKKSPIQTEDDLKNTALYPFYNDNTNAIPQDNMYPLVHHTAGAKQSKSSKTAYIKELEIALQKQIDQTNYFRNTLQTILHEKQRQQKTSDQGEQKRVELQKDVEKLHAALTKALDEKNSKHAKMNEIIRMNEELLRENAIHVSIQRMRELCNADKSAQFHLPI